MIEISVDHRTLVVPLSTDDANLEYNECFCFYFLYCLPTLDQLKLQTDAARCLTQTGCCSCSCYFLPHHTRWKTRPNLADSETLGKLLTTYDEQLSYHPLTVCFSCFCYCLLHCRRRQSCTLAILRLNKCCRQNNDQSTVNLVFYCLVGVGLVVCHSGGGWLMSFLSGRRSTAKKECFYLLPVCLQRYSKQQPAQYPQAS